jgi:branched-subunit amino acid aminotransferase/4-amino-4-deoxychorismate lyase
VLELCGSLGIVAHDAEPLTIREVLDAQEMFLTSACAGVRPVVRVERHAVGDGKPGPVTRQVLAAYGELLDRECPPPPSQAGG